MSPVSPLSICVDEPQDESTINVNDDQGSADSGDKDDDGKGTGNDRNLLTTKDSDAILHHASM